MIIWVIGLSGAGKTTIGRHLYERIKAGQPNTVFLDGDICRGIFGTDVGYSASERRKMIQRYHHLCQMLDQQGINAVCCFLCNQPEVLAENRKHFSKYLEIYLDVELNTLIKRDPKGLYRKVLNEQIDNVVGVDIPFNPPRQADVVIDNNHFVDLNSTIEGIVSQINEFQDLTGDERVKVETT